MTFFQNLFNLELQSNWKFKQSINAKKKKETGNIHTQNVFLVLSKFI